MKRLSPIPKDELKALVKSAKAGSKDSMSRLIELCEQSVYCNCLYLLRNEEEAKDMAQEVLLTVFTKLDTLKKEEAFFEWVKIIAVNKCKNKLKRANPYFLLEGTGEAGDEEADPYSRFADRHDQVSPEKSLDRREVKELLVKCVEELPDAQRLCIVLFYYDDLSIKQIARLMEVSEGTVKSRLAYGRLNLKKELEREKKRGTTLFGRTPVVLLGYVAYFLKKQFDDPSEAAALQAISEGTIETLSTTGAGASSAVGNGAASGASLADAAVAESAYAFVTASDVTLKGALGAFWATTAGKAVVTTVVSGAVIGTVFTGGMISGWGRERVSPDLEKQIEYVERKVTEIDESSSGENPVLENTSAAGEESGDESEAESRRTPGEGSWTVLMESSTGDVYIEDSLNGMIGVETSGGSSGNTAGNTSETTSEAASGSTGETTGGSGGSDERATESTEIYANPATIEWLQFAVAQAQANVDSIQQGYDEACANAQSVLAQCEDYLATDKEIAVRGMAENLKVYEDWVAANVESPGTYSEEEIAEALAQYNRSVEYYNIVYPATIDDMRNQSFPDYISDLNFWGGELVAAEAEVAQLWSDLEAAKSQLAAAEAALAEEMKNLRKT